MGAVCVSVSVMWELRLPPLDWLGDYVPRLLPGGDGGE
jgi:hypothetical protein